MTYIEIAINLFYDNLSTAIKFLKYVEEVTLKLSYIDTSSYLRGLLILIRKDKIVHKNEKQLMLEIGEKLGFKSEIYEKTVNEFLSKKKIDETPPKFSSMKVSLRFIEEAISMAFIDNYFHLQEFSWLNEVAKVNKIPKEKVKEKIEQYMKDNANFVTVSK